MSSSPASFRYVDNHAVIGVHTISELVEQYNTPLYIMDRQTLEANCDQFLKPLATHYPNSRVLYACKANLSIGLSQLLAAKGMCFDVSSGGELYTLQQANIPADRIYFHGNNKMLPELTDAIAFGCTIIVDNAYELAMIKKIAETTSTHCKIMLRIKPCIETNTHNFIQTGQADSKFGIEQADIAALVSVISSSTYLTCVGLHGHLGSQLCDTPPFFAFLDFIVPLIKYLQDTHGLIVSELNCGGGFGIAYTNDDQLFSIEALITECCTYLKTLCQQHNIPYPTLLFEPGRSIAGPAGITVYQVGAIKEIPGIKTYAFVDGGMADNPRPITYGAKLTIVPEAPSSLPEKTYAIAGKFCESGDILAENISVPALSPGDILIVFATGAYNYSMASNYNRNTRPMMICIDNDVHYPLIARESYQDLTRLDCHLPPERL